ncbi:hypothetical protein AVEN_248997-1 [Araneus ventricosus]|uniref:Uncharacterized protein n=1 Tax=Araneus ventricosus TaxID=182803 RepID=A0A4Y2GAJ0_ARAVE|nr:hypothetical protein AVEN_248997-1 [Araneus ventricosus]
MNEIPAKPTKTFHMHEVLKEYFSLTCESCIRGWSVHSQQTLTARRASEPVKFSCSPHPEVRLPFHREESLETCPFFLQNKEGRLTGTVRLQIECLLGFMNSGGLHTAANADLGCQISAEHLIRPCLASFVNI